jgi:hypothetical protein
MELFTKLFGNLLAFVYHCFDGIVIHGYFIEHQSCRSEGGTTARGTPRGLYVADYMVDARFQTGTAPDEQTAMRYPTRASEFDHRRLQVPSSPLHDPPPNQFHAGEREERPSRASGA